MTTPTEHEGPQGDLLLRTMPMPADTSFNGDVFGGWIMSQMDLAGSMMAKEVTRTRTATVAVESMKFIKPVRVGDVVCCYGRVLRVGTTFKVTEAAITYVAIGEDGMKQPINKDRLQV
jgi:acyl-CoA thioesterase YciA